MKAQQKEDATARVQVMNKTESGSVNKMGTKWPNKKHSGQRNNDQQEEKDWTKNCKLCGYEKQRIGVQLEIEDVWPAIN